jgi:hypothetical protein
MKRDNRDTRWSLGNVAQMDGTEGVLGRLAFALALLQATVEIYQKIFAVQMGGFNHSRLVLNF